MIRWLTCLLVLLLGTAVAAGDRIYRTTDEEGNVVFTDDPPSEDAEPVELDPLTTVPSSGSDAVPDATAAESPSGNVEPPADRLEGVRLLYPPSGQPIRHNGGNLPFRLELKPPGTRLPEGYRIEFLLDGEVRAVSTTTEAIVSPVDRGQHTARVRVVDDEGRTRHESAQVQFHLLRAHLGSP